ncbi:MAG: HMA2 domain-containing protein [Oligoflexus sp.]
MDYFIHQSWGRIRIKTPALKNNHFKASLVKQIVFRLDGVRRVSNNVITGSMVINYDPYRLLPARIINLFNSLDLLPNVVGFPAPYASKKPLPQPQNTSTQAPTGEWIGELSRFVFKTVLDKALSQTGKVFLKKIL